MNSSTNQNINQNTKQNTKKYDKDKIIIMTKLATYDKRNFENDSKAGQYFRHDYIYKQNMRMRFFLGIGCLILLFFYVVRLFSVEGADLFTLDFEGQAVRMLFFVLVVMISYSFLGTIIYTREFLKSDRRINNYFKLMEKLEEKNTKAVKPPLPGFDDYDDDDEYEKYEPYTRYPSSEDPPPYRYRSSDDPEFWDD